MITRVVWRSLLVLFLGLLIFAPQNFVAAGAPTAPSNLQATEVAIDHITFTWQDNSNNEERFSLVRSTTPGTLNGSSTSIAANTTSYVLSISSEATTFYYAIRACSLTDCSAYSNEIVVTQPLRTPTGLAATPRSNTKIDLSWTDNSYSETNYKIERKEGSGDWAEIATIAGKSVTGGLTYSNTGLPYGGNRTYDYRVRAFRASDGLNSAYSNTASATTPPPAYPSLPNPTMVGSLADLAKNYDMVKSGNYVYLCLLYTGLTIVDVSNPNQMKILGSQLPVANPHDSIDEKPCYLDVKNNVAVVGRTARGIDIIDISDPTYPRVVTSVAATNVTDVEISGNYAYAVAADGIKIIDIASAGNGRLVASFAPAGASAQKIAISGNLAIFSETVADGTAKIEIYNITNPLAPVLAGYYILGQGGVGPIDAAGALLAVNLPIVRNAQFQVIRHPQLLLLNIVAPANPTKAGEYVFADTMPTADSLTLEGSIVFISVSDTYNANIGISLINVSNPASPVFLSKYSGPINLTGSLSSIVNNKTVYHAALYVSTGTGDSGFALEVLDITNPGQPRLTSKIIGRSHNNQGEMVFKSDTAYLADGANGVLIIDIHDPLRPTILNKIAVDAIDVAFSGNFLFVATLSGVQIYDISGPASPQLIQTIPEGGLIDISGNRLILSSETSHIIIYDIANPLSPRRLGSLNLPGASRYSTQVKIINNLAVTSWMQLDQSGMYSVGLIDIVDLQNPGAPTLLNETLIGGTVYDFVVAGNLAYIAKGSLVIMDFSNPQAPVIKKAFSANWQVFSVDVVGNIAYVSEGNPAYVPVPADILPIDVADPVNPKIMPSPTAYTIYFGRIRFANNHLFQRGRNLEVYSPYSDIVKVTKQASSYVVQHGDEVTFTLNVENTSPNEVANITVSDYIPTGAKFVVGSASSGAVCEPSGCGQNATKIKWNYASMDPGAKFTLTFKVKVD